ncbi:hypothetical protein TRFO_16278 [Tritrichomonas foetus]|uniref:Uncharacterized protein n=1 Tax=Tritrichomonas foetus TaxID=1144522 RepID=A0A1J4KV02_9EUKA|nr:hypothetical protein TRFO_16278 [Tritrichomonas foetus]|eukprot:OHT13518.1 hypothetical protein TRFO_16278 [Tritrichomonas foetus]
MLFALFTFVASESICLCLISCLKNCDQSLGETIILNSSSNFQETLLEYPNYTIYIDESITTSSLSLSSFNNLELNLQPLHNSKINVRLNDVQDSNVYSLILKAPDDQSEFKITFHSTGTIFNVANNIELENVIITFEDSQGQSNKSKFENVNAASMNCDKSVFNFAKKANTTNFYFNPYNINDLDTYLTVESSDSIQIMMKNDKTITETLTVTSKFIDFEPKSNGFLNNVIINSQMLDNNEYFTSITLNGINNIIMNDSEWPSSYFINVRNSSPTVFCKSATIPLNIKISKSNVTFIIYNKKTQFTQNIFAEYILLDADSSLNANSENRINTTFNSIQSTVQVNLPYLDVHVLLFQSYGSSTTYYPFIPCIGLTTSSTMTIYASTRSYSFSRLNVILDFDTSQPDANYEAFYQTEGVSFFTYLAAKSPGGGTQVMYINTRGNFIHGFCENMGKLSSISKSSSLAINFEIIESDYSYKLSFHMKKPSQIPINLCFDCKGSFDEYVKITGHSNLENFSTDFFSPNVQELNIIFQTNLSNLYLGDLQTDNLSIRLEGSKNTYIETLDFGHENPDQIASIEFYSFNFISDLYLNSKKLIFNMNSNPTFQENVVLTFPEGLVLISDASTLNKTNFFNHINRKIYKVEMSGYYLMNEIHVNDKSINFFNSNSKYPFNELLIEKIDRLSVDFNINSYGWKSELNVILLSDLTIPFTVIYSKTSTKSIKQQLILSNFDQHKFANNFAVDHSDNDVDIILDGPFDKSSLALQGTGTVTYTSQYSRVKYYCVCNDDNCNHCNQGYDQVQTISNEDVQDYNNLTIIVCGPSNELTIDLSILTQKVVNIGGVFGNELIKFTASTDKVQLTSLNIFQKLNFYFTNVEQISISEIVIVNESVITNASTTQINVDKMYAQFSHLTSFKDIQINEMLTVTGNPESIEKTIKFNNLYSGKQELVALIRSPENDKITVEQGINSVKIGTVTFNMQNKVTNQIYIAPESPKSTIVISCQTLSSDLLPINLHSLNDGTILEIFGVFPSTNDSNPLITIINTTKTTFKINTTLVPLLFQKISESINFVALVPVTTFDHAFSSTGSSFSINALRDESVSFATINFKDISSEYSTITFSFSQNNININIDTLNSTCVLNTYVDLDGNSKITVNNELIGKINTITATIHIVDNLNDPRVIEFITKQILLITVPESSISNVKIDNFKVNKLEQKPTHGFIDGNFELIVSDSGEIHLRMKENPSLIPYSICFGTSDNDIFGNICELKFTEENVFNEFFNQMESQPSALELTINELNSKENPINFDIKSFHNLVLNIYGKEHPTVFVNFGVNKIEFLTLNNVIISALDSFDINNVTLVDGGFSEETNLEGIDFILSDLLSLKVTQLSTYSNRLEISADVESFSFSISAGSFSLDSIKDRQFVSNLENTFFNLKAKSISFEAEEGLTTTPQINIETTADTINIGSNFDTIKDPKINLVLTKTQNPDVYIESFPFYINDLMYSTNLYVYPFMYGEDFVISEDVSLENKSVKLDVEEALQNMNEFIFDMTGKFDIIGKSSFNIYSYDDDYPYYCKATSQVIIADGSSAELTNVVLNNKVILNGKSSLKIAMEGNDDTDLFSQSQSIVEINFNLNGFPTLELCDSSNTPPKNLIISSENEMDSNMQKLFNNKTFQIVKFNNGKCNKWISKVEISEKYSQFITPICESDDVLSIICQIGEITHDPSSEIVIPSKEIPTKVSETEDLKTDESHNSPSPEIPITLTNEPTDDKIYSDSNNIIINENGFFETDTGKQIEVDQSDNKPVIIEISQKDVTLSSTYPSNLFISPTIENSIITIDNIAEKATLGIRANYVSATVVIPKAKSSINILTSNNVHGKLTIECIDKSEDTLELNQIIANGGNLHLFTKLNIEEIYFNSIQINSNTKITAENAARSSVKLVDDKNKEIKTDLFVITKDSTAELDKVSVEKRLSLCENSKLIIHDQLDVDDNTNISINFYDTHKSAITVNGEIDGKPSMVQIHNDVNNLNDMMLICGFKEDDCQKWTHLVKGNDYHKYAKCVSNEEYKQCLTISTKKSNSDDSKLQTSLIIGIVVSVLVGVIIIFVVTLVLIKRNKNRHYKMDYLTDADIDLQENLNDD